MNNNLDYLNKNEINSFVYTTVETRNNVYTLNCKDVVIDGRHYTKWGKPQIVTFVGLMYSTKNKDNNKTENYVAIGMSKQHPADIVHNKKLAVETARIHALTDPVMVMYNVSGSFNNYAFKEMMETYVNTMDLDFVMTTDELKKKEEENFKNDWDFYLNKKCNE